MKVVVAWSGGKDSALALLEVLKDDRYEVLGLLTTITREYDRVSMHGVRRVLVEEQAKSLALPLYTIHITKDGSNEEYERKMKEELVKLQNRGVASVVFGDIFLEDVRSYRERSLSKLGMKGTFPLWGMNTKSLVKKFIDLGFKAVITCVDSRLLERGFVGRVLDQRLLQELPDGVDPCGENGEYHSFVFDGPIFKRRIHYKVGEVLERNSFYFCDLLPV